jgi:hypothetical protein
MGFAEAESRDSIEQRKPSLFARENNQKNEVNLEDQGEVDANGIEDFYG